jgi:2-C-methyl-D-erythritol 4-phosphate cytidylyltransferase
VAQGVGPKFKPQSTKQNKNKSSQVLVAHAYNPTTEEADIRKIEVQSQPRQIVQESLSPKYPTHKRAGSVAQVG